MGDPPELGRDAPDVPLAVRGKAPTEIFDIKWFACPRGRPLVIEIY